jgi:hypothetical protein
MTISETVDLIALHGETSYALETYGDKRGDRKSEREGYNLYTFELSDLGRWANCDEDTPRAEEAPGELEHVQASLMVGDVVDVFWTEEETWWEAKIIRLNRRNRCE